MFNAESLIQWGGLLLITVAVFCQTGLFFCFFLPSGGLMFTAGVFVATGELGYHVLTVCGLLTAAAVAGNITGYGFGRKAGPLFYERKESRFFRRRHLQTAERFYAKHGGIALIAALFLPIVRTFAPVVAGMIKMNLSRFLLFITIGSAAWIFSFVLAGYLIGSVPALKPYLKYVVLVIILAVTLPIILRVIKELRGRGVS